MNNKRIQICLASAGLLALCAPAMDVVLKPSGAVRFGGYELQPLVFLEGWRGAQPKGEYEIKTSGVSQFMIEDGGSKLMDATISSSQLEDGKVRIDYAFTATRPCVTESWGCRMLLPAQEAKGLAWATERKKGIFERPQGGGIHLSSGNLSTCRFLWRNLVSRCDSPQRTTRTI